MSPMLTGLSPTARTLCFPLSSFCCRTRHLSNCASRAMGLETMDKTHLIGEKRSVNFRLHNVSGYKTELLEIQAADPQLHVLFIPGNPGVVSFYADFLENLYELLDGTASITAVGYISHTKKNWEHRRLFSLEEQINHKMDFIKLELQNIEVPLILVGHSIGSYMSIEVLRRLPEKVIYCIGLYPFLAVNTQSSEQSSIRRLAKSPILSVAVSYAVGLLGLLPTKASRFLMRHSVGKSWCTSAVETLCTHVLQYHVMRNVLFLAMTEFKKVFGGYFFCRTKSPATGFELCTCIVWILWIHLPITPKGVRIPMWQVGLPKSHPGSDEGRELVKLRREKYLTYLAKV